ncbi:LuxR family transcriptional regulator [Jannaschia sp. LMIT008]|uniref:LuxR family transcriptional regulator n=1 Tax=Jannaschia maritima TaxID=3032585 RepID=UPI002810DAA8|nr:LuxR family transcriptional regulator [Jannaschia sp. LMIT008]
MSDSALSDFAARSAEARDPQELWHVVIAFYADDDIPMVSYHHFRQGRMQGVLTETGIKAHGFPADWVTHYLEDHLFEHDPIVALAARTTRPFFWNDIRHLVELTGAEEAMLRRLEAADLGDGLSMQVVGPNLRNGYVGLGFGGRRPALSDAMIFELKCAAQIAHLRYCEMVPDDARAAASLTAREREVLGWIARGKSNAVIADILRVSRHTVDTLVRRIFDKLGVADRTTAAIKGVGAGLILPT